MEELMRLYLKIAGDSLGDTSLSVFDGFPALWPTMHQEHDTRENGGHISVEIDGFHANCEAPNYRKREFTTKSLF
jgi:hypothetical protein